jgi:predicted N-acetyltransferase YhbS
MEFVLRPVKKEDSKEVKKLAEELGYPSTEEKVAEILDTVIQHDDHRLIVAEKANELIGYIHMVSSLRVGSDPFVEIAALNVRDDFRNKGIGKALIAESQNMASEKGIDYIRIRSNIIRKEAHRFFEQRGFQNLKTQEVFMKKVNPDL